MKSLFLAVLVTCTLFELSYAQGIFPGIKSIIQCHKYHNLKYSLRELKKFRPMREYELQKILTEERVQEDPEWISGAVGGVDAALKEFPFMAALGYGNESNIQYLCGGSLISEEFVITAAHCVVSAGNGRLRFIRIGDLNIRNSSDDQGVQDFEISDVVIHPNYSYPIRYNDIALIKLNKPAVFTDYVRPICLDYERKSLKHNLLFAAGWGLLGYGEVPSDILQKVLLYYYTYKTCQKTYSEGQKLPAGLSEDLQICAGGVANITDTCEGDSGGPLFYFSFINGPLQWYLAGITSFGIPCGLAPLPAVYTRISGYVQWIEDNVWPGQITLPDGSVFTSA